MSYISIRSFGHHEHQIHPLLMQRATTVELEKKIRRTENRQRMEYREQIKKKPITEAPLIIEGTPG